MDDLLELNKSDDRVSSKEQAVDTVMANAASETFRVLPCCEKSYYDNKFIKSHSMQANELLRCRWQRYRDNYHNRKISAFNFSVVNDLHFYNYTIRNAPDMTLSRRTDFTMKLKPGPGFDKLGEQPIPNELFMKRGPAKKKVKFTKVETRGPSKEHEPVKQSLKYSVDINTKKNGREKHNEYKIINK
ncbi:hypothetical protein O0L34_g9124 [Tuta absoluta]|nr:hypothetical protein O0L34_g9124 [Tuta absoluta]